MSGPRFLHFALDIAENELVYIKIDVCYINGWQSLTC